MGDKPKRFSITIPEELSERLQETKDKHYPDLSQRELIEIIIRRGLEVSEKNASDLSLNCWEENSPKTGRK